MQSENFDNKIKDSLNQRPPGNDKPEWEKMETLLDQHLPVEKKDRRRIIYILFLFLLLGGGAFFVWQNNRTSDRDITDANPKTENSTANDKPAATDNSNENGSTKSETTLKEIPESKSGETQGSQKTKQSPLQQETNINATVQKTNINTKANANDPGNSKPNKQVTEQGKVNSQPITSVDDNNNQATIPTGTEKAEQPGEKPQKITESVKPEEIKTPGKTPDEQKTTKPAESQPTLTAKSKKKNEKNKNSFFNNLFFTVSAGPDFSTVGTEDVGKVEPVIGAGIGYQVSKKFTIRTGFYSARKIYTADPYDYHPPYNVWTAYPNLKSIDADCKMYEIPVTVDYTISQNKNHSWFVSTGLSSYLMKKEVYDYHYKPNSSQTYITYTKTVNDQNKHYFSVLNFSGGYTRTINKNFSLRAEPYAKFALGGVGYGKVKLNGGGVLVSAIIRPFTKR